MELERLCIIDLAKYLQAAPTYRHQLVLFTNSPETINIVRMATQTGAATLVQTGHTLRRARDPDLLHTCEAARAGGCLALGQNVAHATTRALVVATRAARGRADDDCAKDKHNYCHCIEDFELRSRVGKVLD